jgi:hypothetical protein
MSIDNVITLLISKVCTLEDLINDIGAGNTVENPLLTIAQCFRTNDSNGDPITQLQHTVYTGLIGLKVCEINTTVTSHTSTLTSYGNRLTVLEAAVNAPTSPTSVTLTCAGATSTLSLNNAILNIQEQICTLKGAVGTPTALGQAAALQCTGLSTAPALSKPGTMSAITGWKTTVSTTADSLSNLWLTVCDMRDTIANLQGLVKPVCTSTTVDFALALINNGTAVNLFFNGYSNIPAGWSNCDAAGSKLTITDSLGNTHLTRVNLVTAVASTSPVVIQLEGTPLNLATDLTFTLESCLINGTTQCTKTITKSASSATNACPSVIVTPGNTSLAFAFAPTITQNVSYKIELYNSGNTLINSKTFANPSGVVSDSFTNLLEGNIYKVRAVVTVGTLAPKECAFASYTTINTGGSNSCGTAPTILSATLA